MTGALSNGFQSRTAKEIEEGGLITPKKESSYPGLSASSSVKFTESSLPCIFELQKKLKKV